MRFHKTFIAGILVGTLGACSVSAFAQPLIQEVTAYLRGDYSLVVNGTQAELPEDTHILTYDGRSYLPARFLAEQLGAEVEWIENQVRITTKPEEDDTPGATTNPAIETITYSELPVMKYTADYELTVKMYGKDGEKGDRLWILLKNKQDRPIQLNQMGTEIIADGKTYAMDAKQAADFDRRWYSDIQKDKEVEGFLLLPAKIRDPETLSVTLHISRVNPITGETTDVAETFHIQLT